MLETSYERDGYDGVRGETQWWFEGWGSVTKEGWTTRGENGHPPTPRQLAEADLIVFGFRKHGEVTYKTRVGGLDLVR